MTKLLHSVFIEISFANEEQKSVFAIPFYALENLFCHAEHADASQGVLQRVTNLQVRTNHLRRLWQSIKCNRIERSQSYSVDTISFSTVLQEIQQRYQTIVSDTTYVAGNCIFMYRKVHLDDKSREIALREAQCEWRAILQQLAIFGIAGAENVEQIVIRSCLDSLTLPIDLPQSDQALMNCEWSEIVSSRINSGRIPRWALFGDTKNANLMI